MMISEDDRKRSYLSTVERTRPWPVDIDKSHTTRLYEVINTLWKHETVIGDLQDSSSHIDLLLELVSAEAIFLIRPDRKLLNHTYVLSVKHRTPVYDTVFVALALQLGLELKTYDEKQAKLLSKERGK